jgi:uncharacterized protein (DUF2141 family)
MDRRYFFTSLGIALLHGWVFAIPARDEPTVCAEGPAAAVTIRGLRAPTGLLTVYLYGDRPADFLEHARSLQRIEIPVESADPVQICLPAPRPGRYAVSVRHDVDGNRRRHDMNDGGGFSRNPRLSLTRLRPPLNSVLIDIGEDAMPVDIVLNYRFGMSVRPVSDRPR